MDTPELQKIKTELDDPANEVAFDKKSGEEIAEIMNTDGFFGDTAPRGVVESHEAVECITTAEFTGLSAEQAAQLTALTASGNIDISASATLEKFEALLGAESASYAAILAHSQKPISRAKALGLPKVMYWHANRALVLPGG
jgi:hypothetical protein